MLARDIVQLAAVPLLAAATIMAGGLFARSARADTPAGAAKSGLIVHEWGVAIRHHTSAGAVLASPAELISDLPSFVTQEKANRVLTPQGWNKPVIWFSGPSGLEVEVKVTADQGYGTAHFPSAEVLTRKFTHTDFKAMMISSLTENAGFRWKATLTDKPASKLRDVAKTHWWQTARDAGGLYFNGKQDSERFLFYEATAFQEPTVTARVADDSVTLRNTHTANSGQLLVILNVADKHYVRVIPAVDARGDITLTREDLLKESVTEKELLAAAAGQWKNFGMTEAESAAIAQVWRTDLLKPDRFLLISHLPRKLYDAMFPLTITPAPDEIVRVGLVFDALDSQPDATSWIPALKAVDRALTQAARDLAATDPEKRTGASATFVKHAARGRPILEVLTHSPDAEVRTRAAAILKQLTPELTRPAQPGTDPAGVVIKPS